MCNRTVFKTLKRKSFEFHPVDPLTHLVILVVDAIFFLAVPGRHHAGGILGKVETWLPEGLPLHSLGLNEFWGDLDMAENPELEFQYMCAGSRNFEC